MRSFKGLTAGALSPPGAVHVVLMQLHLKQFTARACAAVRLACCQARTVLSTVCQKSWYGDIWVVCVECVRWGLVGCIADTHGGMPLPWMHADCCGSLLAGKRGQLRLKGTGSTVCMRMEPGRIACKIVQQKDVCVRCITCLFAAGVPVGFFMGF